MSAQTIANRLRNLLAEIEQLDADLNDTNDPVLIFDVTTRLREVRQPLNASIRIAEGAADAEAAFHSRPY